MPAAEQGVNLSQYRYQLVPRVLCFVFAGDEVLLLRGASDKKLWPGKYNGLGGHVERGETIHAAAEREILEEAGLAVSGLRLRGVITIDTGEAAGIGLYVFTGNSASRETLASPEGDLEWVPVDRVGDLDCVEDVPLLLKRLAAQEPEASPFSAQYAYAEGGKLVVTFHDDGYKLHKLT